MATTGDWLNVYSVQLEKKWSTATTGTVSFNTIDDECVRSDYDRSVRKLSFLEKLRSEVGGWHGNILGR